MKRLLALLILSALALSPSPRGSNTPGGGQNAAGEFELRISVPSETYSPRQPVRVTLHLTNLGDEDFFVGRFLSPTLTSPSYVTIRVEDEGGNYSPTDLFTEFLDPRVTKSWWLPIAPGHSYGTEIVIDRTSHPFLGRPGKYRLTAEYFSRGVAEGKSDSSGQDIAPDAVWKGQITSNPVWIRILRD